MRWRRSSKGSVAALGILEPGGKSFQVPTVSRQTRVLCLNPTLRSDDDNYMYMAAETLTMTSSVTRMTSSRLQFPAGRGLTYVAALPVASVWFREPNSQTRSVRRELFALLGGTTTSPSVAHRSAAACRWMRDFACCITHHAEISSIDCSVGTCTLCTQDAALSCEHSTARPRGHLQEETTVENALVQRISGDLDTACRRSAVSGHVHCVHKMYLIFRACAARIWSEICHFVISRGVGASS